MKTIYPSQANTTIRAIFNSFNTENYYDVLTIYNDPNTNSPILFSGSGTISPGILVSTHIRGALTFKFVSDSSISFSGWEATINCIPISNCNSIPSNINLVAATNNTLIINWTDSGSGNQWETEIVTAGALPTGVGTLSSNNSFIFTGLNPSTDYQVYVRTKCSSGYSVWVASPVFSTTCNPLFAPYTYNVENQNSYSTINKCWSGTPVAYVYYRNYFWTTFSSTNTQSPMGLLMQIVDLSSFQHFKHLIPLLMW